MNPSPPVWENAAPPAAGAPLTFHKWRNDIMRLVPILGAPTLLVSTIFIGDLVLPILQGIGEGLALIYIVPSVIISKKDSDTAYDKVIVEFVFLCICWGMWMGSVIRLALLRQNPNCSSNDHRLFFSIFGANSKLPCIFSVIAIVGSSVIIAGLVIWFLLLFVAMSLTPHKRFGQTWGMPAHRLARGGAAWSVDLYDNPTDAQREVEEYRSGLCGSAGATSGLQGVSSPSQPPELEVAQREIEQLRASIRTGWQETALLESRQRELRDAERGLERRERLNEILYPSGRAPAETRRTSIERPRPPRRKYNNDPPPAYKEAAPPGSVPPAFSSIEGVQPASNATNVVREL